MAQQTLTTPKTYPNRFENRFAQLAHSLGWEVTKQGWPDFVCYGADDQLIAVEVKPFGGWLRPEQKRLMAALSNAGVRCFISDGDTLQPFDPESPSDRITSHVWPGAWKREE